MRKALVVGINHYDYTNPLFGCVDDAYSVSSVLSRHIDSSVNFDVKLLTGTGPTDRIIKKVLREDIKGLFETDADISLFYFSGHGSIDITGGNITASDTQDENDGISYHDILTYSNNSPARNRIIILDCCFSGIAGAETTNNSLSEIKEGTTILTASTDSQYALEDNGSGLFTNLLVDALNGAACNLLGDITPGSVYAHIDQSLGAWDQRPVFKTNVKSFVSLRKVQAPISLSDLRKIIDFFPESGYEFILNPTFEPERSVMDKAFPEPDPGNTEIFSVLQKYNRVNLVVPINAPHMWHAAMESKSCKLTALGEHYRRLVKNKRI